MYEFEHFDGADFTTFNIKMLDSIPQVEYNVYIPLVEYISKRMALSC